MIDINTLINNAIQQAAKEALIPQLQGMADLINRQDQRINALESELAVLALRVNTVAKDVQELNDANPCIVERINNLTANQRTPSIEAAVEILNGQEWFWDKLRNFCERTLGDAITSDLLDKRLDEAFDNHIEAQGHASHEWVESQLEIMHRRIGTLSQAMDRVDEQYQNDVRECIESFFEDVDSDTLAKAIAAAFTNGSLTISVDHV